MKNYIISFLIGLSGGVFSTGAYFHYNKPVIKLSCPEKKCEPAIDFDKVKNFRGNLNVKQTYVLENDSAFRQLIIKDFEETLKKLKLSRCK